MFFIFTGIHHKVGAAVYRLFFCARRPHSEPINEKIAGTLFKGGKAEGWGRGILNIFTLCKEAGMPEPEYDFVTNFVCLTIRFKHPLTPHLTDHGNSSKNERLNELLNERLSLSVLATLEGKNC